MARFGEEHNISCVLFASMIYARSRIKCAVRPMRRARPRAIMSAEELKRRIVEAALLTDPQGGTGRTELTK